ncbi:MAG: hypothetical protein H6621_12640 [Halobacteriovoraceae bacterium]|nr:hypothetical protein [Halobacteriovoraceae bacterium]MCB9095908.1 hypothetical protein [Halobacteriovoraceae bacterium]
MTTRPKLEMSLAQSAFIAAKEANSAQFAPQLYRKAEVLYLKAKSAYRQKFFNKAKKFAKLSLYYSERAEFQSVKKQSLNNENNDVFSENL